MSCWQHRQDSLAHSPTIVFDNWTLAVVAAALAVVVVQEYRRANWCIHLKAMGHIVVTLLDQYCWEYGWDWMEEELKKQNFTAIPTNLA